MPADPVLAEADRLYGLPPGDFTAARDARAKELKASGEDGAAELSTRVKKLRKPSVAAWVLNLLVRREAGQVDEVLAVGRALRDAAHDLDAAAMRELTTQRRQLTAAVTTRARRLARESGHKVTEAVADQVEGSLTAAMLDESCAALVRSGLLVTTVSATGPGMTDPEDPTDAAAVPEAAGFLPRAVEGAGDGADEVERAGPALRVVPDPDAEEKARAAAQQALDEAVEARDQARAAADEAEEAVSALEARGLQLQAEIDEHRRALAELEEQAEEVDDDLEAAEDERADARDTLHAAERDHDAARAALDRLG